MPLQVALLHINPKIMRPKLNHEWPSNAAQAVQLQKELRRKVIASDRLGAVAHVGGVDVGFAQGGAITRAAVVVLRYPELALADSAIAYRPTTFPYIPGLLSFREIPAVLAALEHLSIEPDLFLCDGQGLAHPRRFGIACHLGVLLDKPAIGIAKSRLCGDYADVPAERGSWTPLTAGNETGTEIIGAVLRTRSKVKPVFVSSGHRISLPTAIDYVMACTPRYRLPETTRLADRLASDR